MSLGLSIAGTYSPRGKQNRPPAPAAWLNELAQWIEANYAGLLTAEPAIDTEGEEPTLYVSLHPCANPVEVTSPDRGVVRLTATTSNVGPGYHRFLCELMDAMNQELGVRWTPDDDSFDETGYFAERDLATLEQSMLTWLQMVCRALANDTGSPDQADPADRTPMMIAMPFGIMYLHDRAVSTASGPRDRAWLEAVAADARAGTDFFPWWDGDAEAPAVLLRRALSLMWSEVRWAQPLTEPEFDLLAQVAETLADAYSADPSLDYPWREWAEIMTLVDWEGEPRVEVEARAAAADRAQPLIGYRRHDMLVHLPGGWVITLPGVMSLDLDDGTGEFIASDGDRTVRFSAMALTDEDGGGELTMEQLLEAPPEPIGVPGEQPLEPWTVGRITGRGSIARVEEDREEEGVHETTMIGSTVVGDGGRLAIVTLYFDKDADREWAIRTWRSIRHPALAGEREG